MIKSNSRISIYACIIVLTVQGCGRKQKDEDGENRAEVKAIVAVRVCPVTLGVALVTVPATGHTDAVRREKVFSPVAGRILSMKVLEGSSVNAGDVVAVILTKESQAAIAGAEALVKSAATAEQTREAIRTLQLARASQSTASVTIKFGGVVSTRSVAEGEFVTENAELMTVVDLSSIAFFAEVPLRDVQRVKNGMPAEVRFQSLGSRRFPASVSAILPRADAQSQSVTVRLLFNSSPDAARSLLQTDMAGSADIIAGMRKRTLFVPKSALLRDDENNTFSIMLMSADSIAIKLPVAVGVRTDSTVEVQSGMLKEGMLVITVGNYALSDSTKVVVGGQDPQ